MTKIAYIRATNRQQQQQSSLSMPIKSMNQSIILQPSIPSMMMNHQQRPSFPNPQSKMMMMMTTNNNNNNNNAPKPMIMTPTTRFNTNPNVLLGLDQQQQNGVRISKPLMEKRRRARINQCLSQLKTIVVDSAGQYTQNNKCKLEKADILELTVNYVKQLHQEHMEQKQQSTGKIDDDQYMAGYSECVRQMCEYLTKNQSKISYESVKEFLQQSLSITYQNHNHQRSQTTATTTTTTTTFVTPPSPAPSSESLSSSSSSSNHGCSPPTSISSNSNSIIKSSSLTTTIITDNNYRKRKRFPESDTDAEITDDDSDGVIDDDDDDDDDDFGYGSDYHQQHENHPLNLKIMKHDDSQQPRRQQDCFDDDENVWRPW
ncbi:uncharacterized protein LOC124493317 isoform X1 [Dermatophagoides farinae]|uniref:uncharacterized protein LOC124493317 isoform X1 n=1 Tax=Dermatophagoides farinae TaxID=6954 RepID=UPI003F607252